MENGWNGKKAAWLFFWSNTKDCINDRISVCREPFCNINTQITLQLQHYLSPAFNLLMWGQDMSLTLKQS